MNDQTLNIIRRAVERGHDNATIIALLDVIADPTDTVVNVPTRRAGPAAPRQTVTRVGRTIHAWRYTAPAAIRVDASELSSAPIQRPDTTRTSYRLTATGVKLTAPARNPGGNNGAVLQYFATTNNAWSDSRTMRAAGVLAHGEKNGKNKALESTIHNLKTKGLLTMRDKD